MKMPFCATASGACTENPTQTNPATACAASDTFARIEKKYLLSPVQHELMKNALRERCAEDSFAHSTVSSLYYDDDQLSMINRSAERPFYKQKIRVRAYSSPGQAPNPADPVYVELKKKLDGATYKRRFAASAPAARAFLEGMPYMQAQQSWPLACPADRDTAASAKAIQIAREVSAAATRYRNLAPKIMVVVERQALRSREQADLRITFDTDARYRRYALSFDEGVWGSPLFADATVIMEVKCAQAFPLWLSHLLSEEEIYCQPCSKVGMAYGLSCEWSKFPSATAGPKRSPHHELGADKAPRILVRTEAPNVAAPAIV